jgi:hypothetical protein
LLITFFTSPFDNHSCCLLVHIFSLALSVKILL